MKGVDKPKAQAMFAAMTSGYRFQHWKSRARQQDCHGRCF